MSDRMPPADVEAEKALLSCMCKKADCIPTVMTVVKGHDFYDDYHRKIFGVLRTIYDGRQPTDDAFVLKSHFEAMKVRWDAGYVAEILQTAATAHNVRYYAERVADLSTRRMLIELATGIDKQARDPESTLDATTSYARQFVELVETKGQQDRPVPIGGVMQQLADDLESPGATGGLPSGIFSVDAYFGRLQNSELTCIGARPGGGKTTFAMQVGLYNAERDRRSLYVSLEMGRLEFAKRLACIALEIDSRDLRAGRCSKSDVQSIRTLADRWLKAEFPFHLWAPPRATDAEIEARARYLHATGGLDLLVVDYLQIVRCGNTKLEKYQQLGETTMRFKALAKELNIPVIVQSQLKRSESRPSLSSLRESGDIEQTCDNVWLLHRDSSTTRELNVAKFRHGTPGTLILSFKGGRFADHPSPRGESRCN